MSPAPRAATQLETQAVILYSFTGQRLRRRFYQTEAPFADGECHLRGSCNRVVRVSTPNDSAQHCRSVARSLVRVASQGKAVICLPHLIFVGIRIDAEH